MHFSKMKCQKNRSSNLRPAPKAHAAHLLRPMPSSTPWVPVFEGRAGKEKDLKLEPNNFFQGFRRFLKVFEGRAGKEKDLKVEPNNFQNKGLTVCWSALTQCQTGLVLKSCETSRVYKEAPAGFIFSSFCPLLSVCIGDGR